MQFVCKIAVATISGARQKAIASPVTVIHVYVIDITEDAG